MCVFELKMDNFSLDQWIERLKQGDVEFYTRFQEEEWGCRYLGEAGFLVWSKNPFEGRNGQEVLDEAGAKALFSRYAPEKLWESLVKIEP